MMSFTLLPAVDVVDGQAVRLVQGEAGSETVYGTPREAALKWQEEGAEWLHLVDLDAAFGRGSNYEILCEVVGSSMLMLSLLAVFVMMSHFSEHYRQAVDVSISVRQL